MTLMVRKIGVWGFEYLLIRSTGNTLMFMTLFKQNYSLASE